MESTKAAASQSDRGAALAVERLNSCEILQFNLYRDHGKRLLDIVFAIAVLPLVLPLFAILYLVVRRDGGTFLFGHERIGLNGVPFKCLKIRTMVQNSQPILKDHLEQNPEARAEWNEHFKLRNDPRVTPIGKLLRKTSLDELPQIFNVLKGEMSVVGPRPITGEELALYGDVAEDYKRMSPGLTGPWQVTGRRENDFKSRAALDANYVKTVSFMSDSYYVLATIPEVIFCRGR